MDFQFDDCPQKRIAVALVGEFYLQSDCSANLPPLSCVNEWVWDLPFWFTIEQQQLGRLRCILAAVALADDIHSWVDGNLLRNVLALTGVSSISLITTDHFSVQDDDVRLLKNSSISRVFDRLGWALLLSSVENDKCRQFLVFYYDIPNQVSLYELGSEEITAYYDMYVR